MRREGYIRDDHGESNTDTDTPIESERERENDRAEGTQRETQIAKEGENKSGS